MATKLLLASILVAQILILLQLTSYGLFARGPTEYVWTLEACTEALREGWRPAAC